MSPPVIHKSFTIERTYPTTAERVFDALRDPVKKRRWFAEGKGFVVDSFTIDFQVGGFERTRFRYGVDGPPMTNDTIYLDIVDNVRLVFAYSMTIGGAPLSASLASIELAPAKGGTLMRFTENTAFLDGNDGSESRRHGTIELFEALARELELHN